MSTDMCHEYKLKHTQFNLLLLFSVIHALAWPAKHPGKVKMNVLFV